ncbi:3'-5' exoribonuclease YhaM family protein [Paenibacillus chartarius]|uniref:3'-5' exoribonuclease YhaM family protein n=1 Tax=Paenibacillus chartarius TaxID=747481 RepID=A0ABV6DV04_9BACL
MTQLRDLRDRDEFTGFYLLKAAEVKLTNATPPSSYLDMILADATGELPAKLWDASSTDKETFFPLMLVKVQGVAQLYRDKLQAKIVRIRKAVKEDGVDLKSFIRTAPIEAEDLVRVIQATAASITDDKVRSIVEYCIGKVEEKLRHYPAGKSHHHAYYGGLAYHMVRMLELGAFICGQRPFLNADLVKAGILLHDIAKPEEMIAELGIVSDYSVPGKLLGHLAIASGWIVEAAISLGLGTSDRTVMLLQHLVLSHHNLGEWGSPVQPQIPEAVALHYIDQLDAKLQAVEDALAVLPESEEWTTNIRVIENKPIYRPR